MQAKIMRFLRLSCIYFAASGYFTLAVAQSIPHGYVVTVYGLIVHDIYGSCVRTGFFDKSDALPECHEDDSF